MCAVRVEFCLLHLENELCSLTQDKCLPKQILSDMPCVKMVQGRVARKSSFLCPQQSSFVVCVRFPFMMGKQLFYSTSAHTEYEPYGNIFFFFFSASCSCNKTHSCPTQKPGCYALLISLTYFKRPLLLLSRPKKLFSVGCNRNQISFSCFPDLLYVNTVL